MKKLLIANRGEIAVRIIQSAKEMGLKTVAVYSDVDKKSLHVNLADEAWCIGPASPEKSYLNIPAILSVAELSGCDAVHPGYGFLAENEHFVEICEEHGVNFIGPPSSVIRNLGRKNQAVMEMKKHQIPVIEGHHHLKNISEALKYGDSKGYPLIIKAVMGGGGKGIRVAWNGQDLRRLFPIVQAESKSSFNYQQVYIEKFFPEAKHIEIQFMIDRFGHFFSFGERECSVQRNHQKLIEESPSPSISETTRNQMNRIAEQGMKAIQYTGVGTVEFLLDKDENFYFIEVNPRLQVEHGVSELRTDSDIVQYQLRIADGENLEGKGPVLKSNHVIECRINAENPELHFQPSPGMIEECVFPASSEVRIDTDIFEGSEVLPFYDSLIAKVMTAGSDRNAAIQSMKNALKDFMIYGLTTTRDLCYHILEMPEFEDGSYHTRTLCDEWMAGR